MPASYLRRRVSEATKRTLLEVAAAQFAVRGYAATSLDAVVAAAQVTKGALYHHFDGKQALFEAVFERVDQEATSRIRAAVSAVQDPWEQAREALSVFLEVVREPEYRRVVLQDGPAVLGHERFRERGERSAQALVHEVAERVLTATVDQVQAAMVDTFSRILFGAISEAGEYVAEADPEDVEAATRRVELAVGVLLEGLRVQAEAGLRLDEPDVGGPLGGPLGGPPSDPISEP